MKSSEFLRRQLIPVIQRRFGLSLPPDIQIVHGPGLGRGVSFRVQHPGQNDLIESNTPIKTLCAHVKAGGEIIVDHNGLNHLITPKGPLLCLP